MALNSKTAEALHTHPWPFPLAVFTISSATLKAVDTQRSVKTANTHKGSEVLEIISAVPVEWAMALLGEFQ